MMVTKEQIYKEELILIDQIKALIKDKLNFKDPDNYLIPLKVNKSVPRYEHLKRKRQLSETLFTLQEIDRIGRDIRRASKKENTLDQIMDIIYECTESKGEDQDVYLKSQILQILNKANPKQMNIEEKALSLGIEIKQ